MFALHLSQAQLEGSVLPTLAAPEQLAALPDASHRANRAAPNYLQPPTTQPGPLALFESSLGSQGPVQPSGDDEAGILHDVPYVKHRPVKQAMTLLDPANVFHIPRPFLMQHFDLQEVLANGLDIQINAAGELCDTVHMSVSDYKNRNGYSYNRLLGFRDVARKYKGWRVDGWQALDHKTVRITLMPTTTPCVSNPTSGGPAQHECGHTVVQAGSSKITHNVGDQQQGGLHTGHILTPPPAHQCQPYPQQHALGAAPPVAQPCELRVVQLPASSAQQSQLPQQHQQVQVYQVPAQLQPAVLGHVPTGVLQQPSSQPVVQYTGQSAPALVNGLAEMCAVMLGPGVLVAVPAGQHNTAQQQHQIAAVNTVAHAPVVAAAPHIAFPASYGPVITTLLSQQPHQALPPHSSPAAGWG